MCNYRILLLCLLVFALVDARGQQGFPYQIFGKIEGLGNDTLMLGVVKKPGETAGNSIIRVVGKDDAFYYEGIASEKSIVFASIAGKRDAGNFTFFLEEGKIAIAGNIDDLETIAATGSENNDLLTVSTRKMNRFYKRIAVLRTAYQSLSEKDSDETNRMMGELASVQDSLNRFMVSVAAENPDKLAGALFLRLVTDKIPLEELDDLYHNLSPEVRQFPLLMGLDERIAAMKKSVIGAVAADFELTDVDGTVIRLSDYRGKYVLLEFWASWCGPCRAEYPHLKKAYEQFKPRGFEIIGISIDRSETAWKKAIQDESLHWVNLLEPKDKDAQLSKKYGVQPIPDNFLIDPDGVIVARRLRGTEVIRKLEELLK